MLRLLITGAGGFVGQHLVSHLQDQYQILGLTHTKVVKNKKASFLTVDIQDKDQLSKIIQEFKPEAVVHLAAIARTWIKNPDVFFKVNLIGTLNLYEALSQLKKDTGIDPKILYVSSAEVYGRAATRRKVRETYPLQPISYYGSSKAAADILSYQFTESNQLKICILRPFAHIGPGQEKGFFIPDMACQIVEIEKGERPAELQVGNLDALRDYLDVRDVVEAYKLILTKDFLPGEVFNICSGRAVKIESLLKKLLSLSTKKIKVVLDPTRMRPNQVPVLIGDNRKFKNFTDWLPQYTIDQTLKDTLEYWRTKHD